MADPSATRSSADGSVPRGGLSQWYVGTGGVVPKNIQTYLNWLVVWNMNFIFPYIGKNHPNWLSYFSEGVGQPPTSKDCSINYCTANYCQLFFSLARQFSGCELHESCLARLGVSSTMFKEQIVVVERGANSTISYYINLYLVYCNIM